jgi:hypothetical protein
MLCGLARFVKIYLYENAPKIEVNIQLVVVKTLDPPMGIIFS